MDAREYHALTDQSPGMFEEREGGLDFSNQPRPYKEYADLPRRTLPDEPPEPGAPALASISKARADPGGSPDGLDLPALAALCHYATGITKTLERRGQRVPFRAASCTGKLYHVDLYLVCGDLPDLDAGVYHFDPRGPAFDVVREGDHRGALAAATGGQEGVAGAPVTVVATSEWWRNAWKYRDRTYRHAFWDSGTILANLLASAHATGHRAEVVTGFADGPVATLLGVDPEEEAPLELVPVGRDAPAPDPGPVPVVDHATVRESDPVDYPAIHEAWAESTLADGEAAREWRGRLGSEAVGTAGPGDGERIALDPVDEETASARPLAATIRRRGSARAYERTAVSRRTFATVLDRALRGLPADAFAPEGPPLRLNDCYCLIHAVEGVPEGAYQYHAGARELERIGDTDRETAAHLALDQGVVGETAASVYFLADLDAVVDRLGNRGYRLAQLEAGVAMGRLYLATYAHRTLGGRGFTFYDGLVTEHLSPRAADQVPTCLYAFGHPE